MMTNYLRMAVAAALLASAARAQAEDAPKEEAKKTAISGLPAGRYQVRVGLETKVRVITHLTLSWPAA